MNRPARMKWILNVIVFIATAGWISADDFVPPHSEPPSQPALSASTSSLSPEGLWTMKVVESVRLDTVAVYDLHGPAAANGIAKKAPSGKQWLHLILEFRALQATSEFSIDKITVVDASSRAYPLEGITLVPREKELTCYKGVGSLTVQLEPKETGFMFLVPVGSRKLTLRFKDAPPTLLTQE